MIITLKYYLQVFCKWLFLSFTIKGRIQKKDNDFYNEALAGFKATETTKIIVKNKVFSDAKNHLKTKKITHFQKGKSINKPKSSKHRLHKVVDKKNTKLLKATSQKFKENNLEIVNA